MEKRSQKGCQKRFKGIRKSSRHIWAKRELSNRLLKNAHLRRCPHPSTLRRTSKYASLLRMSGALHLGIFEESEKNDFFRKMLNCRWCQATSLTGQGETMGRTFVEMAGRRLS